MDFLSLVILLVIIMDPVGLTPVIPGLLAGFTPRQKAKILMRELLFALAILLLFLVFGNFLLKLLNLDGAALNISGGVLLFMVALGMVFPALNVITPHKKEGGPEDPFIVPIAVPLVAGPSAIAVILLHAGKKCDLGGICILGLAIISAWLITSVILFLSQYVLKILGNRGAIAMERLMGMLLILISVQMFLDGLASYGGGN